MGAEPNAHTPRRCPCHGSQYDENGSVLKGSPRPVHGLGVKGMVFWGLRVLGLGFQGFRVHVFWKDLRHTKGRSGLGVLEDARWVPKGSDGQREKERYTGLRV